MWITINIDVERYDNTKKAWLVLKDKTSLPKYKKFLREYSKCEGMLQKHIESLIKDTFNPINAEAEETNYSSLLYHHKKGKETFHYLIRVECNNKKVEFPNYYPLLEEKRNIESEATRWFNGVKEYVGIHSLENEKDIINFLVCDVEEVADAINYHDGDFAVAFGKYLEC